MGVGSVVLFRLGLITASLSDDCRFLAFWSMLPFAGQRQNVHFININNKESILETLIVMLVEWDIFCHCVKQGWARLTG